MSMRINEERFPYRHRDTYPAGDVPRVRMPSAVLPRELRITDTTFRDGQQAGEPFPPAAAEPGARYGIPVKLRLCDTLGLGLPWREAALPRSVPRLVASLRESAGIEPHQLEWHGHDDLGKVHANAVAAWLAGCVAVN